MNLKSRMELSTMMAQLRYKQTLERAQRMKQDKRKKERMKEHECINCFYTPSISGQAFSDYECENCGEPDSWPNTGVPTLCERCAEKNSACRFCLANINFQENA